MLPWLAVVWLNSGNDSAQTNAAINASFPNGDQNVASLN
jgi:hypothetical protein